MRNERSISTDLAAKGHALDALDRLREIEITGTLSAGERAAMALLDRATDAVEANGDRWTEEARAQLRAAADLLRGDAARPSLQGDKPRPAIHSCEQAIESLERGGRPADDLLSRVKARLQKSAARASKSKDRDEGRERT